MLTIIINWIVGLFFSLKKLVIRNPPIPVSDADSFRLLFLLTSRSMSAYAVEATKYQRSMAEAKTTHKKDFYQRKFNKVKPKFQDELKRLYQLHHIMSLNGIEVGDVENDIIPLKEMAEAARRGESDIDSSMKTHLEEILGRPLTDEEMGK